MEHPSLSHPSTGEVYEANNAVGGSWQTFGDRGNHQTIIIQPWGRSSGQRSERTTPSDSRRVSDQYELQDATPYDPNRRANSPDRATANYGRQSTGQRFDRDAFTGTGSRQRGNSHSHNHPAINYIYRYPGRTAMWVIIAIAISLLIALPIVLAQNARSSRENSTDAQDSSSFSLSSSASPSQTPSIASTTTSSTGAGTAASPTTTSSQPPLPGDILTTVSVPSDDSRFSTFITWTCRWGCPGKPCSSDTDCGKQVISALSISREMTCDFEAQTCA